MSKLCFYNYFFFTFPFLTSCSCAYVSILCKSELWLKECMLERGLWSMKNKNDMVMFLGSMSTWPQMTKGTWKQHQSSVLLKPFTNKCFRCNVSLVRAFFICTELAVHDWQIAKKSDYTHYCWCYCMSFLFGYAITRNIIQQLTI